MVGMVTRRPFSNVSAAGKDLLVLLRSCYMRRTVQIHMRCCYMRRTVQYNMRLVRKYKISQKQPQYSFMAKKFFIDVKPFDSVVLVYLSSIGIYLFCHFSYFYLYCVLFAVSKAYWGLFIFMRWNPSLSNQCYHSLLLSLVIYPVLLQI